MESTVSPRRAELLGATLRKMVRRGARSHVSNLLGKTRPEAVAVQMRGLTPSLQVSVFRILHADYPQNAGEVLTELEAAERVGVLEQMTPEEVASLLERMPVDDAVSVIETLPAEQHEKVLELVDVSELQELQEQLLYEDETAGRIMDPDYFALPEDTTVGEAIERIQSAAHTENVFYLYLVDDENHLQGVTSLRQLLLTPPSRKLSEVGSRSIIKVHTDTDREEVARLAARYDLLAIPVTDGGNRLVGIVTLDDLIDVVKDEANEDFMRMVGTSENELVYQERSLKVAGIRLPWLLVNLGGLGVAGALTQYFQVGLQEALFLLTFVPVVMGMGGNIGSQTSTIAVRGLATGRVALGEGRGRHFLWQQLKIGMVIGGACAALAAIGAMVLEGVLGYSNAPQISLMIYALVVGVSLFLAIVLASFNGAVIPLLFERWGIDPAVAAGPLVTTTSDITGIVIYFGLASALIDLLIH